MLLLAGCTDSAPVDEPSSLTTSPATTTPVQTPDSQTTTQTPTVDPSSDEEQAKQAVIDFWAMQDELASKPEESLTRLAEVARGQALEAHRANLFSQAQEGLRQEGAVVVTPTHVGPGDSPSTFVVTACLDVSDTSIVDAQGNSVVPAGRPDQAAFDYTVERDGDQWFVVEDLLEAKDC
ncbi:MAG: hypothetical protein GX643_06565 [Acidimicrobiales bacterium]|nr:hypothetical protein [Acidimicrobiales bacterium]